MDYGYIYLEYNNTRSIKKNFKYPFDCQEFKQWTYMYVNPILSSYVRSQNIDYLEGKPVSKNINQKILKSLGLQDLQNVEQFYFTVNYKTNF